MNIKKRFIYLICVYICFATSSQAFASNYNDIYGFIQNTFNQPDSEIDLAHVKLTIDKYIDPSKNTKNILKKISKIENDFNARLASNMKPLDKALSLSTFLYERGHWNNKHPFVYDFADPFGSKIGNKLLSNYLETKKGNCISMPILYVILADRLHIDVTLSTAPLHVFVKFKDSELDKYINLETTDRGRIVPNQFYKTKATISEEALKNKVYLQPLSKKQSVAVIAILLSEYFASEGEWQKSIDITKLILQNYPNYAYAMIKIGNGYSKLLTQKVTEAKTKGSYTKEEKLVMDNLYKKNIYWFDKAETIGWIPTSQQENKKYLDSVKKRVKS